MCFELFEVWISDFSLKEETMRNIHNQNVAELAHWIIIFYMQDLGAFTTDIRSFTFGCLSRILCSNKMSLCQMLVHFLIKDSFITLLKFYNSITTISSLTFIVETLLTIFDWLSAHLQKSKKAQLISDFWLNAIVWRIKKGLDFRPSP